MSVCLSRPSNCFFFFVSRWNRAISWPSVQSVALYKTLFLHFWFRPPNAQNLLPKIGTKSISSISRLVWQIDQRCLGLPGGFRPIQWNHAKYIGADPHCHGNDIGLGTEIKSPTGLSNSLPQFPDENLLVNTVHNHLTQSSLPMTSLALQNMSTHFSVQIWQYRSQISFLCMLCVHCLLRMNANPLLFHFLCFS